MAICPDHGPYAGSCKKCKEDPLPFKPVGPTPETKIVNLTVPGTPPIISDGDKYLLKSRENDALAAQIEMRDAQGRFQAAQQVLSAQMQALFSNLGIEPKDWVLDFQKMVFVRRETNENLPGNK